MKRNTRTLFSVKLWLLAGALGALALFWLLGTGANALPAPEVHSQEAIDPLPQRAVAGGEGARLLKAPGGAALETLPLATAMWVTGRTADDAWLQVELEDGRAGWVSGDEVVVFGLELVPVLDVQIQHAPTPATSSQEKSSEAVRLSARVNSGRRNLNLRRGPAITYGIVGVAKNGQELKAIGRDATGDWLLVALPGQEGEVAWAAARYLDVDGDPAGLPVSDRLSRARIVRSAAGYNASSAGLAGKLVFQTSSGGPIMVYDLASGDMRQLTNGMHPAISPDGKTVAFIRDDGGDAGLWLIGMDAGNERRIFSATQLRTPAWSPDGARIVFSRVTGQDTCRDVGHGICLPDAPWLGQFPLKVFDVRHLSRVNANGGDFMDIPSEKQAYAPDWGKDGIVYQSQSGLQITKDGSDSANRPLLTDGRYQDPVWRPDGSSIAFVSLEKDHREIFRVQPDGSGMIALTHPGDFIEYPRAIQHVAPAWSPDGKHIVYLSDADGDWALYVMDADGQNQRKLPISIPITYAYQGEQVVDWGR